MDENYSEAVRKKYRYREMILKRKIGLKPRSAARLIGPDCAYHLYSKKEFNHEMGEKPQSDACGEKRGANDTGD